MTIELVAIRSSSEFINFSISYLLALSLAEEWQFIFDFPSHICSFGYLETLDYDPASNASFMQVLLHTRAPNDKLQYRRGTTSLLNLNREQAVSRRCTRQAA